MTVRCLLRDKGRHWLLARPGVVLSEVTGACQSLGAAQTAMARAGTWLSLAAMAGYQVVNRSRSVPSRALVRVCRSRWAPCFDHCICCFLAKRRLITRLTVDSANAVEIRSPLNQRSL